MQLLIQEIESKGCKKSYSRYLAENLIDVYPFDLSLA